MRSSAIIRIIRRSLAVTVAGVVLTGCASEEPKAEETSWPAVNAYPATATTPSAHEPAAGTAADKRSAFDTAKGLVAKRFPPGTLLRFADYSYGDDTVTVEGAGRYVVASGVAFQDKDGSVIRSLSTVRLRRDHSGRWIGEDVYVSYLDIEPPKGDQGLFRNQYSEPAEWEARPMTPWTPSD